MFHPPVIRKSRQRTRCKESYPRASQGRIALGRWAKRQNNPRGGTSPRRCGTRGADNRLIDCALIDARLEARRGRGAHVRLLEEEPRVLDRVPTISLSTSERAGDLSRKIYSFIHTPRRGDSPRGPSRDFDPYAARTTRRRETGLSPVPSKILLERFDIRVEGLCGGSSTRSARDPSAVQATAILNRDLPECARGAGYPLSIRCPFRFVRGDRKGARAVGDFIKYRKEISRKRERRRIKCCFVVGK